MHITNFNQSIRVGNDYPTCLDVWPREGHVENGQVAMVRHGHMFDGQRVVVCQDHDSTYMVTFMFGYDKWKKELVPLPEGLKDCKVLFDSMADKAKAEGDN